MTCQTDPSALCSYNISKTSPVLFFEADPTSKMTSLIAIVLLAFALLSSPAKATATPLPPSKDPFYTAPEGFKDARPGEVLRLRVAPGNLTALVNNTSQAYNILFRTTDARHQPSWAVTTLFLPQSAHNNPIPALLSYQAPYNSPNIDQSPSYAYHAGRNPTNSDLLFTDVEWALHKNWAVNVPDFEGPLAAFTAGPQAGHAVLDSIRAVKSVGLGLSPTSRVALWGYSGGSLASAFAAEMQPQYAPALQISGCALGGLIANATRGIEDVNAKPFAGLIALGLLGATAQYPEARDYVLAELLPTGLYNSTMFLSSLTRTVSEMFAVFAGQDTFDYFRSGRGVLASPLIKPLLYRDGVLGSQGIPRVPLLVYNSVHDEATRIADVEGLVSRYCAYGAEVLLQRNLRGDHLAEVRNGRVRARVFLERVLEGRYEGGGCRVEDVDVDGVDDA